MEKDIKIFGDIYLDTDSDPKINKGSDYVLNTVIQSDGRFGVAVNIKGNELVIDLSSYYSSIYNIKVAGSCRDEARNRIIFFIKTNYHNDYGSIWYYDIATNTKNLILYAAYLDFGVNVVSNVIGDLLYWTDGVFAPRKINYIKAYNLNNSISTDYKYAALSNYIIEAYKKPPSARIGCTPLTSNLARVTIPNKIYQFAYRYTYADFEKSVLSPFSDVVFSDIQQFPDGTGITNSSVYAILLSFNIHELDTLGGVVQDIESVELFVRNSDSGNWYLYDKIFDSKLSSFVITYYSSGTYNIGGGIVFNSRYTITKDVYDKLTIGQKFNVGSFYPRIVEKFTIGSTYIIGLDSDDLGAGSFTAYIQESFRYIFKDDKVKQEVDQTDLARPFDFLPQLAGTQELIEKDRLIYGDITQGFDNIDIDVDTNVVQSSISFALNTVVSTITILSGVYYKLVFASYPINTMFCVIIKKLANTVAFNLINFDNFFYTAYYTSKAGDTDQTIFNALRTNLIKRGVTPSFITVVHNTSPSYYYLRLQISDSPGGLFQIYNYEAVFTPSLNSTYKTMKDDDSYMGAITYYDKNLRHSFEQKFDSDIVIGPQSNLSNIFSLSCSVKNLPPIWAYYYSLDFTKRIKVDTFIRLYFKVDYTTVLSAYVFRTYAYFDQGDNFLRIQVNRLINDSTDIDPNLKLNGYTFKEGDRIRLYGNYRTLYNYDIKIKGTEWPKTDDRYQKDYATTPAYIVDNAGNKIENTSSQVVIVQVTRLDIPNISSINAAPTSPGATDFFIVSGELTFEIYTPKKESSNPYYFPNYFGQIGNPGTTNNYHIGNVQNQSPVNPSVTPAIVTCNPGDTYLKLRFANFFYPSFDDNYSDYYESNSYGLGMPNLYKPDAKKEQLISGMISSGTLLEDTKINKLNQFISSDLEILKSKFGTINSLKEVGNVLKVLQDRKETSIYISRTEMQNADNTSNVVKSTTLLGTANIPSEDRGTIFPNSIVVHNRNMYYFDLYKGEVVRSSANGQYPISEYGMRTYFKNKSKAIQSLGLENVSISSAFDEENKMYLLTFIMGASSETIGFYDPEVEGAKPRWISFFSFIPEHYESFGSTLLSFNGGKGYKHNSNNVTRTTFYGVKFGQKINWYSNAAPIIKKVFKVLGLKTNKPWDVPVILIEPDSTYTRGMKSLLKPNHFELKEGEYSAAYLKNMNTTSSIDSVLDLFNGDELRGYALKHQMENMEDGEVWIMEGATSFDASNKY
jgi:hypothetical protein